MLRSRLPLALLLAALACQTRTTSDSPAAATPDGPSPTTTDAEELHAFARLYGYVRYFHPSDEAAALDWESFAVHGVQRVTQAETQAQLAEALEALFGPVAPTLDVYPDGQTPTAAAALFPADTTGLDTVAWQHRGYGFGDMTSAYASNRTHRTRQAAAGPQRQGTVVQEVEVAPLRGRRVRQQVWGRIDPAAPSAAVQATLWVRHGADQTLRKASAHGLKTQWQQLTVEADVPEDAKSLTVGVAIRGQGAAWVDDVSLQVREGEGWVPVELENAGFESHETRVKEWDTEPDTYEFTVNAAGHDGQRSLKVARRTTASPSNLFEATPQPGELWDASLGAGLRVQLPLSLYSKGDHTLGPPGAAPPPPVPDLSGVPHSNEDPAVRTAAVIVAWNVFQHFYPYFGDIDTDWNAVLPQALDRVSQDTSAQDTFQTLRWMVAQLHDGHGRVNSPLADDREGVPVRMAWIEDQIVITAAPEGHALRRGDVVRSIDGQDAIARLDEELGQTSGSVQWKRFRALTWGALTFGPPGSVATFEVLREGKPLTVKTPRDRQRPPPDYDHEAIEKLDGDIWFIDLSRAEYSKIYARIEDIAKAPGVVFDLRGYPNGTHPVLRHLMTEPEHDKWMQVPQIIYPDHERTSDWQEMGWDMTPAPPHIEGKVAFITGGGAISYAESVMGYVEGLRLGEIVGGPTAGANGNINPFTTPGGYQFFWTGMRVVKHDGSPHHTLGVTPTIPATRTVAGVAQGRDELLERALAVITEGR